MFISNRPFLPSSLLSLLSSLKPTFIGDNRGHSLGTLTAVQLLFLHRKHSASYITACLFFSVCFCSYPYSPSSNLYLPHSLPPPVPFRSFKCTYNRTLLPASVPTHKEKGHPFSVRVLLEITISEIDALPCLLHTSQH